MIWMVEQRWLMPEGSSMPVVAIRSVVEAETEQEAQEGAAEAILQAIEILNHNVTEPASEPVVLYAI